ncbi:hypothetical protein CH262_03225 [Rhodococcus sp. 05-2255-1e]|uniref:hypothetical protein n=1 Tax=unclassified Rhodococcus (in: high G+C Gram-positive bacteria) TaxID=192944 RepID=UPI000B9B0F73|nr:hypothetical protein [Rhodococcus sp. 05-2255-1e]OZE28342.1 hypothetical protein CH262_03225 [Rhodococcus sp. 05-2255-1e]
MAVLYWLTVALALTSFITTAIAGARLGLTLRHTTICGPLDDRISRNLVLIGLLCAAATLALSAWPSWGPSPIPL